MSSDEERTPPVRAPEVVASEQATDEAHLLLKLSCADLEDAPPPTTLEAPRLGGAIKATVSASCDSRLRVDIPPCTEDRRRRRNLHRASGLLARAMRD